MQALVYTKHGETPKVSTVPMPTRPLPSKSLMIKNYATSINPADWKSADGGQAALIGFDWPRVIGFDFSGVVVEVARDCDDEFKIGDRVFGMIAGLPEKDRGCAAEYLIVDAEVCVKKPDSISHAEAASVPLVGITAVMMLEACGLKLGSKSNARVLVLGGAGGVGSVAIQIAKKMFGASFVATTASKGKKETLVKSLGADLVIDYRSEKFETKLASQDDSKLFDAILACTNEASRCPTLLRKGGALCSIIGSDDVRAVQEWIHNPLVYKHHGSRTTLGIQTFLGSYVGGNLFNCFSGARSIKNACVSRGANYRTIIGTGDRRIMTALAQAMNEGKIRAVIDSRFSMDRAADALAYQRKGRAAGKVIVDIVSSKEKTEEESESSSKQ
eukprot:g2687.t1